MPRRRPHPRPDARELAWRAGVPLAVAGLMSSAWAFGALAVANLAVRRAAVARMRVGELHIGRLVVDELDVRRRIEGPPA